MPTLLQYAAMSMGPHFSKSKVPVNGALQISESDLAALGEYVVAMHGMEPPMRREWQLHAWADALELKPRDLVERTGWSWAKVSLVWNGKQDWKSRDLFEMASALQIEPYELLLPPHEAMALRHIKDAIRLASRPL